MFHLPSSRQRRRRNRHINEFRWSSLSSLPNQNLPPKKMENKVNEKMIQSHCGHYSLGRSKKNERKKQQTKDLYSNATVICLLNQDENNGTRNIMGAKQKNGQRHNKIFLPSLYVSGEEYLREDDEITVKRSNVKRPLMTNKVLPKKTVQQYQKDRTSKSTTKEEAKQAALREYRHQQVRDRIKRRLKKRLDKDSLSQINTPQHVVRRRSSARIHNRHHSLRSRPYSLFALFLCISLLCSCILFGTGASNEQNKSSFCHNVTRRNNANGAKRHCKRSLAHHKSTISKIRAGCARKVSKHYDPNCMLLRAAIISKTHIL